MASSRWLRRSVAPAASKFRDFHASCHKLMIVLQLYTTAEVAQGGQNAMTDQLIAANKPFYPDIATTGISSTSRMYIPCFAALPSAGQTNSGAAVSVLNNLPICSAASQPTLTPTPSPTASPLPSATLAPTLPGTPPAIDCGSYQRCLVSGAVVCLDTLRDPLNCGRCGNACVNNRICTLGTCLPGFPQPVHTLSLTKVTT